MQAAALRRRAGKEPVEQGSTAKEQALVINMTEARNSVRAQFLVVGLFLSVLLVSPSQVIEHMKKVWKVRGELETIDLEAVEGRKYFILDFSEEGDMLHATRGGPWQFKGDAFLVEALAPGADPSSSLFTHVPMWVQFHGIPFYLLTKELARALGNRVGSTLMIDNNARGGIYEKFLRTRVQLPLYLALQRWIKLVDKITTEEVQVQIRYERLPNFCLFCGYIGHMEARCDLPAAKKKLNFSQELRVPPVHFADPRSWFLPEKMGRACP
uniref:Uncharacterized protein n=1 Tax=Avena sativa TaxID=4498 RepID=A0ACD5WFR0_AVESA